MCQALLAGAVDLLACASPTLSQSAKTYPQPSRITGETAAVEAEPAEGLGEIVVTAQRKPESLQKATVPVDVVTGDTLLASGLTAASELGNIVLSPAVQTADGADVTVFLRGVAISPSTVTAMPRSRSTTTGSMKAAQHAPRGFSAISSGSRS